MSVIILQTWGTDENSRELISLKIKELLKEGYEIKGFTGDFSIKVLMVKSE